MNARVNENGRKLADGHGEGATRRSVAAATVAQGSFIFWKLSRKKQLRSSVWEVMAGVYHWEQSSISTSTSTEVLLAVHWKIGETAYLPLDCMDVKRAYKMQVLFSLQITNYMLVIRKWAVPGIL